MGLSGHTRREFLKRSAIAGVAAWSAPMISTLPGGAAWAYHGFHCTGLAYDAKATFSGPVGGAGGGFIGPINMTGDDVASVEEDCLAIVPLATPSPTPKTFLTLKGDCVENIFLDTCRSRVTIADVALDLGAVSALIPLTLEATALNVVGTSACGSAGPASEGTVELASLKITFDGVVLVDDPVVVPPNTELLLGDVGFIKLNEQTPIEGGLNIIAIHISVSVTTVGGVTQTADVKIGYVETDVHDCS